MLDQRFNPKEAEARIYKAWEEAGCFKPGMDTSAEAYSIVIPPPNVTGSLHMGHALNNTLQDILVRYHRMTGKNVRWQPGMDHAGIATQMVVERQLAEQQLPGRRDMGRDAFVEKVWEWKEQSGGNIEQQLRRLGASLDWDASKFTLDEDLSKAVTKVFVELYNDGLIYRDKRLVNWDPHFQTAISDLEVEQVEVKGSYWHLRYPLADGVTYKHPVEDEEGNPGFEARDYLVVATSRPETMLGDTCVAVHPDDERYASLVGKEIVLPIVGRRIPIVADEYPDPEKGSGAVKITPAHDFNDFDVGKRHGQTPLNILTSVAAIVDGDEADAAGIPADLRGLDRFEARKRVVELFEEAGLLAEIESVKIEQPFGDRSKAVIEPWMTDQWYVDAKTLAQPALEAVREGKTKLVPANWDKTYYNWMEDIQPWCISRQLWWGHRIPVWYGPDGEPFVAMNEEEAITLASNHYIDVDDDVDHDVLYDVNKYLDDLEGRRVKLEQDPDVLDTWFSSALWPFSTQGWPDETTDLKTFYPTATLCTAFDIIFFWVARMMMMGIRFMDEVPFETVYIHAIVRDESGKKMSKSEGNVIDPVDLIDGIGIEELVKKRTHGLRQPERAPQVEKQTRQRYPKGFDPYGADALRFTLAAMATQGRDMNLSVDRVAGYRNFGTKLWNAVRFSEMNECASGDKPAELTNAVNQWIIGELAAAEADIRKNIEAFRFNDAADAAYRFVWNLFCDWYLELIKPLLNGDDEALKAETRATCGYVIDEILKLLHPFMPFITEELWEKRAPGRTAREGFLMLQQWPAYGDVASADASQEVDWVISAVSEIRSVRSTLGVPAGAKVPMEVANASDQTSRWVKTHSSVIEKMARLASIEMIDSVPAGRVTAVAGEASLALDIAEFIDIEAEKARLTKEIAKLDKENGGTEKRLGNQGFLANAPAEVVEELRERLAAGQKTSEKLAAALNGLGEIN